MASHIIAQDASWSPWSRLSLQAGLNYVLSETKTPASEVTPGHPERAKQLLDPELFLGTRPGQQERSQLELLLLSRGQLCQ